LIERIDTGARRTGATGFDHFDDRFLGANKHCFNRSIAAVAHPATQATLQRVMLDESAVTDALHTAAH
jgi:hypothetical protein